MRTLAFGLTVTLYAAGALAAPALDTANIEKLTGLKGKLDEKEGVFKVTYPRSDLAVSVGGVKKAGLHVVAIHNHMTGETPRVLLLHDRGVGAAAELARGVRSALATQKR